MSTPPASAPSPGPRPRPGPRRGAGHPSGAWHVVVPVKDTRTGKSRLAAATGEDRSELSRAIAQDTLEAVVACVGADRLVLVTSDADLAGAWRTTGATVVADPGAGLNAAVAAGVAAVPAGSGAAALLGDLPALTPDDLAAALDVAEVHAQAVVPDRDGTGTVLRTSRAGAQRLVPRFGVGSAAAHEADGAHRLEPDLPRLRTDVDDAPSLAVAHRLGVGPATTAVLRRRASGWIRSMQATVHHFDPYSRTGSVLRDDGRQLHFDADAFDGSGLRLLRLGQRLTVEVVDEHVVSMRILGIGDDQVIH